MEISVADYEKILKAAWRGELLPTPCVKCNGLFNHATYCPDRPGRDLVILSPEDYDDVESLRTSIASQPMTQNVSFDAVQSALRKLANSQDD